MATKKKSARLPVYKTFKLYVGGKFPRTESGRTITETSDKGEFVANLCRASRKDFRMAVNAARSAQAGWAGRAPFNRSQIFYRMGEMLESRRESFEKALVDRAGYKASDAEAEVSASIDRLIWYGGWADKFIQVFGNTNPVASPHFNFTMPEATGVVTSLAPRTAPLLGMVTAMAPVILSGNTAIVIVDHDHRSVVMDFAEVLHCSDLPGGVVNILTGHRDELIKHVAGHMDVDAVAAFDATAEERKILGVEAAENVKRVHFFEVDGGDWASDEAQSPYWILPFVEFKTAWHPMGSMLGKAGGY